MLAYTGLETVANLAEETREPGRTLPRSLFSAIGLVVILTVLIAVVGLSAFPVENGATALGDEWLEAPLVGHRRRRSKASVPGWLGDPLRVYVGLDRRAGAARRRDDVDLRVHAARALARRARAAPAELRPAEPRTLVSPQAILAAAAISIALVLGDRGGRRPGGRSSRASTPSASCSPSRRRSWQ